MSKPEYMTIVVRVPESGVVHIKEAAAASGGVLAGWAEGNAVQDMYEMEQQIKAYSWTVDQVGYTDVYEERLQELNGDDALED